MWWLKRWSKRWRRCRGLGGWILARWRSLGRAKSALTSRQLWWENQKSVRKRWKASKGNDKCWKRRFRWSRSWGGRQKLCPCRTIRRWQLWGRVGVAKWWSSTIARDQYWARVACSTWDPSSIGYSIGSQVRNYKDLDLSSCLTTVISRIGCSSRAQVSITRMVCEMERNSAPRQH